MKHEIEHSLTDGNLTFIHVDKPVHRPVYSGTETFYSPDSSDTKGDVPALVKDLFEIDGIAIVNLKRYEIMIRKGRLFSWDVIIPQVISVLEQHLDPKVEI